MALLLLHSFTCADALILLDPWEAAILALVSFTPSLPQAGSLIFTASISLSPDGGAGRGKGGGAAL